MKKVTVSIDDSMTALISELAQEQHRSVPNFLSQFLRVSLDADTDREALNRKMNPVLAPVLAAIRKERDRLTHLAGATR